MCARNDTTKFAMLLIVSILESIFCDAVRAQSDTLWTRRFNYSASSTDFLAALTIDRLGNLFVVGNTVASSQSDYLLSKIELDGSIAWSVKYDGPSHAFDRALVVDVDSIGNVYISGQSSGTATGYDIATVKYSSTGSLLWVRRFDGSAHRDDEPTDIRVDEDGNVYVCGYSSQSSSWNSGVTVKYSPLGDSLWAIRYATPTNVSTIHRALDVLSNGTLIVVGSIEETSTSAVLDYLSIMYNANGDGVWVRRLDSPQSSGNDYALDVVGATDGGAYVYGNYSDFGVGIIRYDSEGAQRWLAHYDGQGFTYASGASRGLLVTPNGGVFGAGYEWGIPITTGRPVTEPLGELNSSLGGEPIAYGLVKYDTAGTFEWSRVYDKPGVDQIVSIAADQAGDVYVSGYDYDINASTTVLYSHEGDSVLTKRFPEAGPDQFRVADLAVDPLGHAVLVGSGDGDALVVKYGCVDSDEDGVCDAVDNCPCTYNPDQLDTNGNGTGEVCEGIHHVTTLADSGPCSLRESIARARECVGGDSIHFALCGDVSVLTQLPPFDDTTGGIVLDGRSAPGASEGFPVIRIDFSSVAVGNGFLFESDENAILGVEVTNSYSSGIAVSAGTKNEVRYNHFYGNGRGGTGTPSIDLLPLGVTINDQDDIDFGPNDLLNYPVFDSIFETGRDTFTVFGTASPSAAIELFLAQEFNDPLRKEDSITHHGPAYKLLGSATADGSGHFQVEPVLMTKWSLVTATATDTLGNTSEFSRNKALSADPLRISAYSIPVTKGLSPAIFEVSVSSPIDSLGQRDSIGPGYNTFGDLALYNDAADFDNDGTADVRVTILSPDTGLYNIKYALIGDPGTYLTGVGIDAHLEVRQEQTFTSTGQAIEDTHYHGPAVRGDLNSDGVHDIFDVVAAVDYVFRNGNPPEPWWLADVNCDEVPDIFDVVRLVDTAFRNAPPPTCGF